MILRYGEMQICLANLGSDWRSGARTALAGARTGSGPELVFPSLELLERLHPPFSGITCFRAVSKLCTLRERYGDCFLALPQVLAGRELAGRVWVVSPEMRLLAAIPVGSGDLHSLSYEPAGPRCAVADTASDCVRVGRFRCNADGMPLFELEFSILLRGHSPTRVSPHVPIEPGDTRHVNGLDWGPAGLVVSMFGEKSPLGWRYSREGVVAKVWPTYERLATATHPHSPMWGGGARLFFAASGIGAVQSVEFGGGKIREEASIEGYARGIAFTTEGFAVGASASRTRSRHTGVFNAPVGRVGGGKSGLFLFRRDELSEREFVGVERFGYEVFDVLRWKA